MINGNSTDLENVTYQGKITPSLDKIHPRYGTVKGGTLVVLTGNFYNSNYAKVKLDNHDCKTI